MSYIPVQNNESLSCRDTWNRWEAVKGALEDVGFTDVRPAPMPSLAYVPRHLRPGASARG